MVAWPSVRRNQGPGKALPNLVNQSPIMADPMEVDTTPPVAPDDDLPPDTEPVFLEAGDGEEVQVDDSAPIFEEEDCVVDEEVDDTTNITDENVDDEEEGEHVVPVVEIGCHRGPIYALSLTQKVRRDWWRWPSWCTLLILSSPC